MDSIILKIPADNKYICTVRLAISSIASLIDMDIETIEDLKVSISETMNLLVNKHDDLEFKVNLYDEKIEIEVITEKYGDSFILDAGYNENSMTSGREFLEYINEVVKPENQFWK